MTSADPAGDPFALLGLPRAHAIDRGELERRYLELSKELHPDRFVGAPPAEQRRAVERASAVNTASRVLRDPVARAERLCKLGGVDLDSTDPERGAPSPGQAFLVEMIELRDALGEAPSPAARDELRAATEARALAAFDHALAALAAADARAAARHLVVHRYLQRFLDEIDAA